LAVGLRINPEAWLICPDSWESITPMAQAARVHDRRSTDTLAAGRYAPIEVDDPYEAGEKIVVLRQLRCDPLARLHSHRQIDEAQYLAGRSYQRDWEIAERGARAIDPTKEAVDGGMIPEPLTDRQAAARERLISARAHLGRRLAIVVDAVLLGGQTMEQIAQSKSQAALKLHGGLLRVGLDELAVFYSLSTGMPLLYSKSPVIRHHPPRR
jgi:hypothetical protein